MIDWDAEILPDGIGLCPSSDDDDIVGSRIDARRSRRGLGSGLAQSSRQISVHNRAAALLESSRGQSKSIVKEEGKK